MGMGPAIFKHQGKETLYSLRLLPIGGYCKMEGEEEYSDEPRSFSKAKVWKRLIVVVSGAFMNFLLGFIAVVLSVCIFYNLIPTNQVARFVPLNINGEEVGPFSNSENGLKEKDIILKINGSDITVASDITYILGLCQDETVSVTVKRGDEIITLDSVSFYQVEENGMKGLIRDFSVYGVEKNFFNVLDFSGKETVGAVKTVYRTLNQLITGKVPITGVSGIVGVGGAIEETVSNSESFAELAERLLYFLYLISINLAVMNLLPFPALDGGHVVFLIYEAIFKKPVPEKLYTILNGIGFAVLILFVIFITFKDIFTLVI